jgi:hypothetical protein
MALNPALTTNTSRALLFVQPIHCSAAQVARRRWVREDAHRLGTKLRDADVAEKTMRDILAASGKLRLAAQ